MLVKLLHLEKADEPIVVTLSGITTLVNLLQEAKAFPKITLQFSLISHDVIDVDVAPTNTKYGLSALPRYFALSYTLYVKLLQSSKADEPMVVTLSGITMLVKLVQP